MKTVTIEVTQEDIDRGKSTSCYLCPIALASHRLFDSVEVGNWNIMLGDDLFKLPKKAQEFIVSFDLGDSVKPFNFELQLNEN